MLPCGEDEASLTRHLNMLNREVKKLNPNKQSVQLLMKKTFSLRRKQILEGIGTVQEILALYSALKYPEEVSYGVMAVSYIFNVFYVCISFAVNSLV